MKYRKQPEKPNHVLAEAEPGTPGHFRDEGHLQIYVNGDLCPWIIEFNIEERWVRRIVMEPNSPKTPKVVKLSDGSREFVIERFNDVHITLEWAPTAPWMGWSPYARPNETYDLLLLDGTIISGAKWQDKGWVFLTSKALNTWEALNETPVSMRPALLWSQ